jgi:hypothetical protein
MLKAERKLATDPHRRFLFFRRRCREEELHALRARFCPQLCIWLCHIYFREAMTIFPVKCLAHFTDVRVGLWLKYISVCPWLALSFVSPL